MIIEFHLLFLSQSLPGVAKLEEHVREEHSDTATGKMKANFRQFMDRAKAKTTAAKKKVYIPVV